MNERSLRNLAAFLCMATLVVGCAVRPKPDPRNPAPVRNAPWLLRVCHVEGDGAHLEVGDQVEITTNRLGRLRIRHLPQRGNRPWNDGEDTAVKAAVLVERVDPRAQSVARQFVPVGRFKVELGDGGEHAEFDFQMSKVLPNRPSGDYPACKVDVGADEVIIRGVEDYERHGGVAHLNTD